MKRLFILIAALILAVNSAITAPAVWALPRNVALRNTGSQASFERLVRGLEPTLWLRADSAITQADVELATLSGFAATRATWTANQAADPFTGETTAYSHIEDGTASSTHFITDSFTLTSGEMYVVQIVAKTNGRSIYHSLANSSDFAGFGLDDGTIVSGSGTIIDLGGGWYECTVTHTATGTGSSALYVNLMQHDGTTSYNGDGASGAYIASISVKHLSSNVTQWDSLVGSISFTQSTVANQPVLTYSAATGHKGVVFDGSDDVMTSASTVDDIIDNDAAETFIVFQSYGSTGASQYLLNGTNREYQFQIFSGDLYYVNDDGGTDQIQDTSFEFATDYVMAGRHADGRIYMSLNGVEATDVASGDTIGMTETLFLGDRSGSSGEFNGPFYEIITFDKVLSDNQRQAIIEGLESKYRID